MADSTRDSERLLSESRALLRDNQKGGRHRRSIGKRSSEIKNRHYIRKLIRVLLAIFAILVGSTIAGMIIGGIGFAGVMLTILAIVAAVIAFSVFPKLKVPRRADLTKGDVRTMVGQTELWLEHQRAALPPPAVRIIDDLGVQLDTLGLQLETVDQNNPAAREVRKLVGEHLPGMIDSYRKVPPHLRKEERAGSTPDEQLTEGLKKISEEIDSVTRQLADGALDDLAIKHRYLDYRYGGGETSPEDKA